MTRYIYFVSYRACWRAPGPMGAGNMSVSTPLPITTWEDVEGIQRIIKEKRQLEQVIVINYQLLRIEGETDANLPTLQ